MTEAQQLALIDALPASTTLRERTIGHDELGADRTCCCYVKTGYFGDPDELIRCVHHEMVRSSTGAAS
jgi:hypothetical protein